MKITEEGVKTAFPKAMANSKKTLSEVYHQLGHLGSALNHPAIGSAIRQ
jgi:hypothetical protein